MGEDTKAMGANGQYTLIDNGTRLLRFADEHYFALVNIFFSASKGQGSHTYQSPKGVHPRYQLDYLLTRQSDRCLLRSTNLRPSLHSNH
ncbi:unnamed protein product [Discosporangium mesarthrocarpum]